MKRTAVIMAAGFLMALGSASAKADLIRYHYSMQLTAVQSDSGLDGFLEVGEIVSGFFTIDTDQPPLSLNANQADYFFAGMFPQRLYAGGRVFEGPTDNYPPDEFDVLVRDNFGGGPLVYDEFLYDTCKDLVSGDFTADVRVNISTDLMTDPQMITSLMLSETAPDLGEAAFPGAGTEFSSISILGLEGGLTADARVLTLEAVSVPEPSTIGLLGLGLVGMGLRRRKVA